MLNQNDIFFSVILCLYHLFEITSEGRMMLIKLIIISVTFLYSTSSLSIHWLVLFGMNKYLKSKLVTFYIIIY